MFTVPKHATLQSTLADATKILAERHVDSPRLSAEILLAEALGMERNDLLKRLILAPKELLAMSGIPVFTNFLLRRMTGEPVAYITGRKEFFGRDFFVTPATLIPRPETEELVEHSVLCAQKTQQDSGVFVDFGTGSGCIGITVALALPHWQGIAVDKSREALAIAQKNAHAHNARTLHFLAADFTLPLLQPQSVDILISNPPYISEEEYKNLDSEVRAFEPKTALVPTASEKSNGLEHLEHILVEAAQALQNNGWLLMEIGYQQATDILVGFPSDVWASAHVVRDMSGHDRILIARRRPRHEYPARTCL